MTLSAGKRDVQKIAAVLEADYETVEEAARAALAAAWELYESKAKFAVAGQVYYSKGYLGLDDERASMVVLGPFGTLNQAQKAGDSLAYSSATGEQARWWAVPMWHGTPAAWYDTRKEARKRQSLVAEALENPRELRHAMQVEFWDKNPGATELPEHLRGNGWDGLDEFLEREGLK